MNHQSTITPLVTNQPIPSSDLKRDLYGCHQDIDFFDLLNGINRRDARNTDQFIHREGITFRDYVGCQFLTGNELVYYPELAKTLRAIEDYPILKRCYQVDTTLKGLELLKCFYDDATQHLKDFQREWEQYSNQVDALINSHGHARYLPLIDHMEIDKVPYCHDEEKYSVKSQVLIINEVKWPVNQARWENPDDCPRAIDFINLHRFLRIDEENYRLYLEDFMKGTPFVQLRLLKTCRHKGRTQWYNLDTRQAVSKTEALCWKKPV